jgi:dihydroorotate dehydrogenase electron transfer subunit
VCTSKRFDQSYKIISNKKICADYFELKIKTGDVVKHCSPGQFFMIDVPGVFLRRPISIYNAKKGTLSFLYKVIGKGTKILSGINGSCMQSKQETSSIDGRKNTKDYNHCNEIKMLGPLGKGYDLETYKESNHIIVAGGTGIASIHFLATKLKKKGTLYYGARSKEDLLCLDKFKKIGWKVIVSTEDGSKGYKGYITGILAEKLKNSDTLFACGPTPMLKKVLQVAKSKNVKGFVSLEDKMACGIGNCQGCAVKINDEIKMICKDGPVFKIEQVEL